MSVTNEVAEQAISEALIGAFQKYGYDGASLAHLSEETGLIKASLYHRFPKGKEQMATAALEAVEWLFRNQILAPLESDLPPKKRLDEVLKRIRIFYANGRKSCLLDTLSLNGTPRGVARRSQQTANLWAGAFAKLAQASGMTPSAAKLAAEDALVQIEGALIMARLTGTSAPFERALARLPSILLA